MPLPKLDLRRRKPWIPVNENYPSINVAAAENDPNSILHYYRKMIAFRKAHLTLVHGDFEDLLPEHPQLYCYRRWDEEASFLMVHNFSDQPTSWALPEGVTVLGKLCRATRRSFSPLGK